MLSLLRFLLLVFGVVVLGIGFAIALTGPAATATFFGGVYNTITGGQVLPTGFEHANVDNEMRFFSVFWLAFGVLILKAAISLPESTKLVLGLSGVFFVGGLFRLLSVAQMGPPHGLFNALMWMELIVPVLLSLLVMISIRRG